MKSVDRLRDRHSHTVDSEEYRVQQVISEITEDIVARLDLLDMSRVELASQLDVTSAMVTKLLRGQNNFTVRTLVQIADALGCSVNIKLPPCGFRVAPLFVSEDLGEPEDSSEADSEEDIWTVTRGVA